MTVRSCSVPPLVPSVGRSEVRPQLPVQSRRAHGCTHADADAAGDGFPERAVDPRRHASQNCWHATPRSSREAIETVSWEGRFRADARSGQIVLLPAQLEHTLT